MTPVWIPYGSHMAPVARRGPRKVRRDGSTVGIRGVPVVPLGCVVGLVSGESLGFFLYRKTFVFNKKKLKIYKNHPKTINIKMINIFVHEIL